MSTYLLSALLGLLSISKAVSVQPITCAPMIQDDTASHLWQLANANCHCEPCHLCHLTSTGCQLQAGNIQSNTSFVQPSQDAATWFLSAKEIKLSRGGYDRDSMTVYSTDNDVRMHTTGNETYVDVLKDIEAAGQNDFIYLSGWGIEDVELIPGNNETSLKHVLKQAAMRGVSAMFLVWDNPAYRSATKNMERFVNKDLKALAHANGAKAHFIRDGRIQILGSHHQKTIVIKQGHQLVGYVGGVDIMTDRWDSFEHDQQQFRQDSNVKDMFDGWLDGHLRVVGTAARDVLQNFLDRWNDPQPLGMVERIATDSNLRSTTKQIVSMKKAMKKPWNDMEKVVFPDKDSESFDSSGSMDLTSYEGGRMFPQLPKLANFTKIASPPHGQQSVQIVRTFPCGTNKFNNFAPAGEMTLFDSRVKAIRAAKNYIFVQDQYFVFIEELMPELRAAMSRIKYLVLMVQKVLGSSKPTGYRKYQYEMIQPLLDEFPDKIILYNTGKEIYIHSKIVIVDDVYVSIGSGNWNMRSMTSDSELTANVVGGDKLQSPDNVIVTKAAFQYRVLKFAEAAQVAPSTMRNLTFDAALHQLQLASLDKTKMLLPLKIKYKPYYPFYTRFTQNVIDPDGRCHHLGNVLSVMHDCRNATKLARQSRIAQDLCNEFVNSR